MNSEERLFLDSKEESMDNNDSWVGMVEAHKRFMDMLPEAAIICRNKKIVFANNCAAYLLQCDSREELAGKNLCEYIYVNNDENQKDRVCKQLFGYNGEIIKEIKILTAKKQIIDGEIKCSSLKGSDLRLLMLIDKSEFTKLRTKQENIEKKYKIIFGNANDAILLIGLDKERFNILDANDAACEILGYTNEEFLKLSIYDIQYDINKIDSIEKKLVQDGRAIFEEILKRKDGNLLSAEVSAHEFELNGERVLLAIARDITERKEIEKRLKESEDRSRGILELIPEGIFVHDGEKLLYANPEAKRILKMDNGKDYVDKPIMDFIHSKYKNNLIKIKERMQQPDYIVPLREEKLVLKDGAVVDVEALGTSIIYGGEKASIVAIRDIGYRKKAEELKLEIEKKKKLLIEAKEHERLRVEFFSNISHEFKTPLNAILTTQQLLKLILKNELESNASIEHYMDIMKKNCYRILRVTNNILDITEMDSGYYKVNVTNNDIVDTINQIIEPVDKYLANRGIDFTFTTDIEKMVIACDSNEIQRVLLNLISNSIKAIDSYGKSNGKIEVSLYKKERNIKINVRDNGCGIPEDKLEYVFDALRQVDKSFTRHSEGSGMGLYIAKYIIEEHGGRIKIKSRYGLGSEFQVILPIKKVNEFQEDTTNRKVENYIKNYPSEKVSIEFSDIY